LTGNETLISLHDVSFCYPKGEDVLRGADLTVRVGERIGLVGPIGSGKTTLLHLIVGLLKPDAGAVEVLGHERKEEKDFWEVRERVGLLFQDPDDQLFSPTVREDIAFGPLNQGRSREETDTVVRETLATLNLDGFEDRITHHLSGGEKRLVSIATVLAMKPDVLLLDEPVNGLDEPSAQRVRELLLALPQAMVIVSHDREFLDSVTTRCVELRNGRVQEMR
jgi:cobalt/nickel transport system ATP-binding protein